MIATLRTMTYPQLKGSLEKGARVIIWSCNTCARFCEGMGGREAVERLANRLREDGFEVVHEELVTASCLLDKVISKVERHPDEFGSADVIIPLTCSEGQRTLEMATDVKVLDACRTVGHGIHSEKGMMITFLVDHGQLDEPISLQEAAEMYGLHVGSYC
jgi:hypothetical protein